MDSVIGDDRNGSAMQATPDNCDGRSESRMTTALHELGQEVGGGQRRFKRNRRKRGLRVSSQLKRERERLAAIEQGEITDEEMAEMLVDLEEEEDEDDGEEIDGVSDLGVNMITDGGKNSMQVQKSKPCRSTRGGGRKINRKPVEFAKSMPTIQGQSNQTDQHNTDAPQMTVDMQRKLLHESKIQRQKIKVLEQQVRVYQKKMERAEQHENHKLERQFAGAGSTQSSRIDGKEEVSGFGQSETTRPVATVSSFGQPFQHALPTYDSSMLQSGAVWQVGSSSLQTNLSQPWSLPQQSRGINPFAQPAHNHLPADSLRPQNTFGPFVASSNGQAAAVSPFPPWAVGPSAMRASNPSPPQGAPTGPRSMTKTGRPDSVFDAREWIRKDRHKKAGW